MNIMDDFTIDCTGDVVVGDTIFFTEIVWGGSYRKPINSGKRDIIAKVLKDSYGDRKQQHTFTLEIIDSVGVRALRTGLKINRKGRNIYRNGTRRLPWKCPEARDLAQNEKHNRGDEARRARDMRRSFQA